MKFLLIVSAVAIATANAPVRAADVAVSVSIGQPGFYGRIDIGGYPEPQVIYRQPRLVEVVPVDRPPIYLHVPPGHAKHWSKHCHEYNACGERVFFVHDNWYSHEYVPRYQEQHRERRNEHRDERRGEGGDDDHGHGHGRNKGHDHEHDRH